MGNKLSPKREWGSERLVIDNQSDGLDVDMIDENEGRGVDPACVCRVCIEVIQANGR